MQALQQSTIEVFQSKSFDFTFRKTYLLGNRYTFFNILTSVGKIFQNCLSNNDIMLHSWTKYMIYIYQFAIYMFSLKC
jgi:hypothetical protein